MNHAIARQGIGCRNLDSALSGISDLESGVDQECLPLRARDALVWHDVRLQDPRAHDVIRQDFSEQHGICKQSIERDANLDQQRIKGRVDRRKDGERPCCRQSGTSPAA